MCGIPDLVVTRRTLHHPYNKPDHKRGSCHAERRGAELSVEPLVGN
jgi:hypothetical protein